MLAQFAVDVGLINNMLFTKKMLANIFVDVNEIDVLVRFAISRQHFVTSWPTIPIFLLFFSQRVGPIMLVRFALAFDQNGFNSQCDWGIANRIRHLLNF